MNIRAYGRRVAAVVLISLAVPVAAARPAAAQLLPPLPPLPPLLPPAPANPIGGLIGGLLGPIRVRVLGFLLSISLTTFPFNFVC